ncbi:unnamed protein product [Schistosoma mattheei]|uniref:Uncharacterized protein n=1 Tax=Schistosoma mattheei TaxID=31246 RepID=A0A183PJW8_9TREM|nr:unnamed protein product [Schistosoma mattheei]
MREFSKAWNSGQLAINKHIKIDPIYQSTRKIIHKHRNKSQINGSLLKLFVAEVRDVRATADYWSKKTTNLEKSYHNLHGKVKDYRFNAKQSENEYLKAMEERDYFLQSVSSLL